MKTKITLFLKNWLFHFAGLVFLFNFFDTLDFLNKRAKYGPFLFKSDGTPETVLERLIRHNFDNPEIFAMLAFTLLVELLYHFVFKRFKWFVFILSVAFCCLAVFFIYRQLTSRMSQGDVEPISVLIGYAIGYALLREFFNHKLYLLNVRLGRSQTELQVLKQQLDPHFLFNTLNYLYGTALQEKAERTAEGIDIMSGMMRYTLTGNQTDLVALRDEIHFIEQYIYLQKVRLSLPDPDPIKVKIDTSSYDYKIAPMLLIPFIENAFKHGISNEQPAEIAIEITTKGAMLTMSITNAILTGHTVKGTQSGLFIAKKRLELLYPDQYSLTIEGTGSVYQVLLNLTLAPLK